MNSYCKIYTLADCDYDNLLLMLKNSIFCICDEGRYMSNQYFEMELRKNKDRTGDLSDFLFWPFLIEVESISNDVSQEYINHVNALLHFLREHKIRVVPSCDFEELLGQKPEFDNEPYFV